MRGKRMLIFLAAALVLNFALIMYLRFQTNAVDTQEALLMGLFLFALFQIFFAMLFIDMLAAYSRDLNHKEGYMVFLTPHSGWQIIGAKLLTGFIEGIGFLIFIIILIFVDMFVIYENAVNGFLLDIMHRYLGFTPQQQDAMTMTFIAFTITAIVTVLNSVLTAYAAMTIRRGFFAGIKVAWLITGVVYVVLSFVCFQLGEAIVAIFPLPGIMDIVNAEGRLDVFFVLDRYLLARSGIIVLITALIFAGTGYILEKKVDL
jgi:hypothetical protein